MGRIYYRAGNDGVRSSVVPLTPFPEMPYVVSRVPYTRSPARQYRGLAGAGFVRDEAVRKKEFVAEKRLATFGDGPIE